MVQKYVAVLLVMTMFGLACPAMAGDFVNPKLLPKRMTYGQIVGTIALSPQTSQRPMATPGTPAKSSSGELTTGGKVMKWVGVGLMGGAALDAVYGGVIYKQADNICGSYNVSGCSSGKGMFFASAGVVGGIGLVLFLIGRTKKQ